MWIICLLLFVSIICLFFYPKQISNYQYLGDHDLLGSVDVYSNDLEKNEECMMLYGDRHCMMTDGRLGKCVLSGYCAPAMMTYSDDVSLPYCTKPYFKEGCDRFCKCQKLRGENQPSCMSDCHSMFHPY